MNNTFRDLDRQIFKYFLKKLECYVSNKVNSDNFSELFNKWAEEKLNSPIYFNKYVNEFFGPELHIAPQELLLTLKLYKLSFKDYIVGIMNKFDVKSSLIADDVLRESEDTAQASEESVDAAKKLAIQQMLGTDKIDLSNVDSSELDNIMGNSMVNQAVEQDQTSEEDVRDQKKALLSQKLGSDNINVDGLSDEEIDALLSGNTIHEKISNIVSKYSERTAIYYIHKYLGMNLRESASVYREVKRNNN